MTLAAIRSRRAQHKYVDAAPGCEARDGVVFCTLSPALKRGHDLSHLPDTPDDAQSYNYAFRLLPRPSCSAHWSRRYYPE